jgi:DNA polymerase III subunit alpha
VPVPSTSAQEPTREVEVALPGGFKVSPKVRAAVKSLPGILDVHDI